MSLKGMRLKKNFIMIFYLFDPQKFFFSKKLTHSTRPHPLKGIPCENKLISKISHMKEEVQTYQNHKKKIGLMN